MKKPAQDWKITPRMIQEIVGHEGVVRQAYKDSKGVWTWSVGLTNGTGHMVTRYIDDPQPMRKCIEIFMWAMEEYMDRCRETFHGHMMTEAQMGAALSFEWNTGGIKRASWVRKWKAGDRDGAWAAFLNWKKPPSIIGRRKDERNLFFKGRWKGGKAVEWTRLKPNKRVDWGSGKQFDIEPILADIVKMPTSRVPEKVREVVEDVAAEGRRSKTVTLSKIGAASTVTGGAIAVVDKAGEVTETAEKAGGLLTRLIDLANSVPAWVLFGLFGVTVICFVIIYSERLRHMFGAREAKAHPGG